MTDADAQTPGAGERVAVRPSVVIGGLLLLGLAIAHWALPSPESQAIEDLSDVDRRALFDRTLETLKDTCKDKPPAGLVEHCSAQARFILQFPECDDACKEHARLLLPQPTR